MTIQIRLRRLVEIGVVFAVLLVGRELLRELPYANAWFMGLTLLAIGIIVTLSGEGVNSLGLGKPSSWKSFAIWTVVALAGTVVIGVVLFPLLADWLGKPEGGRFDGNVWITLIAVGWFAAAFGEEVTMRGFILPRLAEAFGGGQLQWLLAIVIQALIFAVMHKSALGITVAGLFGFFYGLVFWWSGKQLWPVIIAHALPDTVSIISSA